MTTAQFEQNLKIAGVNRKGHSVAIDIFNNLTMNENMSDTKASEIIIRNFLSKNVSWINAEHNKARANFQYLNNRY